MLPEDDLIFSLKHRLALQQSIRDQHRQLQASAVRVLARIEAAEQARRTREEVGRPAARRGQQPRRGVLARIGSWFGVGTPTPTSPEQRDPTRDGARQPVATEAPSLLHLRDKIAKELEGDRPAVVEPPTKHPVARLVVAERATDPPDDHTPPTRWG